MQIRFSVLFNTGENYCYDKDPGIVSEAFAKLRGSDFYEAREKFPTYSKFNFSLKTDKHSMYDIAQEISGRMGFDWGALIEYFGGYSPLYVLIFGELVNIENSSMPIADFLNMYPPTDMLQVYFYLLVKLAIYGEKMGFVTICIQKNLANIASRIYM